MNAVAVWPDGNELRAGPLLVCGNLDGVDREAHGGVGHGQYDGAVFKPVGGFRSAHVENIGCCHGGVLQVVVGFSLAASPALEGPLCALAQRTEPAVGREEGCRACDCRRDDKLCWLHSVRGFAAVHAVAACLCRQWRDGKSQCHRHRPRCSEMVSHCLALVLCATIVSVYAGFQALAVVSGDLKKCAGAHLSNPEALGKPTYTDKPRPRTGADVY